MADSPLEVVNAFIRSVERRDFGEVARLVTEDVVYHNVPLAPVSGADAVVATLRQFVGDADEVRWEVHHEAANGDVVFNERTDRSRRADKWNAFPVVGVWLVREGRIAQWRDYFDLQTVMAQLEGSA